MGRMNWCVCEGSLVTEDGGEICTNWIQWTDRKRLKQNGAITAIEIWQGKREVLTYSNFLLSC